MGENLKSTGDRPDFHKYVRSEAAADIVFVDKAAESQANRSDWDSGKKTVAVIGVAEQLPSVTIPKGYSVFLKALKGNAAKINVAEAKASAEDDDNSHQMDASDTLILKVDNVDKIWVDADSAGEGLTWAVEI